jgi:hypothetical protein
MPYGIAQGDVLAVLRDLPSNEFDALLCDPPYGLRFMGKRWDYDVPSVEVWAEALRVLKPGAPLIAFGGTRTFHRMAVNIEDAGFELRDCLCWLYGKGFPKFLNVGLALDKAAGAERPVIGSRVLTGNAAISTKEKGGTYGVQVGSTKPKTVAVTGPATELAATWSGYGTALKPGWEPAILARKPPEGTVAGNVETWGVGGLAIDACRIGRAPDDVSGWSKTGSGASENVAMTGANYARDPKPDAEGRWPANVCLDEDAAVLLDASVAPTKSVPYRANVADGAVLPMSKRTAGGYADAGGPSRFFYCAKVSTKEREAGCGALPLRSAGEVTDRADTNAEGERPAGLDNSRAGAGRGGGARNHHPTLKPLALAKWLAALIKPPGPDATILVPYSGAGSEMIGALQAGWGTVFGIEQDESYIEIAHARIKHWIGEEA